MQPYRSQSDDPQVAQRAIIRPIHGPDSSGLLGV